MDKNFIQNSIYKRDTSNSVDYLYSYCIVEVQNVESRLKSLDNQNPRSEALIRIGTIGSDVLAEDDDVILVIAPQNGLHQLITFLNILSLF